ncbi:hypothetical protein LshimejAT787_0404360 [Lyophyllum shimeji]|uniref:Uncharacterized protein n=1 Tax=Lyophyllum shimeji TaxID=47721 RepID=A0A9P3PK42_LYOSH|nr:hypothetical protein LshimejAT787_0404360 [Lyophyllum shimeji]
MLPQPEEGIELAEASRLTHWPSSVSQNRKPPASLGGGAWELAPWFVVPCHSFTCSTKWLFLSPDLAAAGPFQFSCKHQRETSNCSLRPQYFILDKMLDWQSPTRSRRILLFRQHVLAALFYSNRPHWV